MTANVETSRVSYRPAGAASDDSYTVRKKIRFLLGALPVLAVVGTVLRIAGVSLELALVSVTVLLGLGFMVSVTSALLDAAQRSRDSRDREQWREADQRWQEKWEAIRTEQLRELAQRHYLEERAVWARRASASEMAEMIQRHADEWDELLRASA